ncbi:hypothetical protein HPP92_018019 [Vanilla planifolia]|uniref:Uncharacterized protein n=1 Tax=Vanilla planifolia TaxID=51239 RepID=A0A835QDA4_VANPL|nr:hypothetical protein HPP92_018019 [Vanilla planifolia]
MSFKQPTGVKDESSSCALDGTTGRRKLELLHSLFEITPVETRLKSSSSKKKSPKRESAGRPIDHPNSKPILCPLWRFFRLEKD